MSEPLPLFRLDRAAPHARFLANPHYSVLVTAAGTGYSKWNDYLLTAWSPDRTEETGGLVVYLRDLDSGDFWSLGHQPVGGGATAYEVCCQPGVVALRRVDGEVEARLEICVAADDDVEIRRLAVRNLSERRRRIEVTTYAEVVLLQAAAYAAHPGFAKLFVETELADRALLARRRPRSATEEHPWMVHALHGSEPLEYETDRARFLGRGRDLTCPLAMASPSKLTGTVGSVLDPVFSLRRTVVLDPGESAELVALLAVAPERDTVLELAARYSSSDAISAAFAGAAASERQRSSSLGLEPDEADWLQELAGAMLFNDPSLRAPEEILARAEGTTIVLDRYGVGGDGLLAVVGSAVPAASCRDDAPSYDEAVRAASYWRRLGLEVRLALLCEDGEADALRRQLKQKAGELVILSHSQVSADLDVLLAAAHLVARHLGERRSAAHGEAEPRPGDTWRRRAPRSGALQPEAALVHGYSADGHEYVIGVDPRAEALPPMPWINAVSNESFGFLISERGAGYTWSQNSRENRLTPWSNDPIRDPHDEAHYLRDQDSGAFWSPLPGPCPAGAFEVRHAFGASLWLHNSHELEQEVLVFVPRHDPVKITRIRLTNRGQRARHLGLFSYHRLVLGVLPEESGRFVVTSIDQPAGILLARNRLNNEFASAVVFTASSDAAATFSGDRTAFLGRYGSVAAPAAVIAGRLEGRTGAGLDPCAAIRTSLRVEPGETVECLVLFGEAPDEQTAAALVARYRSAEAVEAALAEVRAFWRQTVTAIEVETPSPAIDRMLNGWLLYQVLSCRLWGRSAFYQSGGAFGFRDQLQDAAAVVYAHPERTRAQILLHAAHQFVEGDVLHWWHPPTGRGIRTRFADDLNWLPYITAFYIQTTGDWSVLDEPARFVTARLLEPGEDEAYLLPTDSGEVADVYLHCCRALDRSLTRGPHGLPLFGTGDWNDGMNRVGREGRGESVWMAFFLHRVIEDFLPSCERRGDVGRIERYRAYQRDLEAALEAAAWDGQWYRRGYYDDGTPLGSAQNLECRIDGLAQAWSVISAAVPRARAEQAMEAVERMLVDREAGLIRLLTPPFDRDPHDPGYVKGYVPGIRENGGQYTHAAVWVVQALAELGHRDRAAAYLEMLSPVWHTATPEKVAVYQVEPYALVADIYGVEPHLGRGGWTWYTGSAGWMYRVGLGSILGVHIERGEVLRLKPCIPDEWPGFRVRLRLLGGRACYDIEVRNPDRCSAAVSGVEIDGAPAEIVEGAARVPLATDGAVHRVVVVLGQR